MSKRVNLPISAVLVLSDFQNFCTVAKRMKFPTKPIQHYPPHLRHVVGPIPWEIKNSNFHRYLADMEENANKMHLSASILIPLQLHM